MSSEPDQYRMERPELVFTMMPKKVILMSCALLVALVIASVPVAAEDYTTYRLKEIRTVYSTDPPPTSPLFHIDSVYADASGGYFKYTQKSDGSTPECKGAKQSFSVEWTFDRNVSVLTGKKGDKLFSVMGKITGDSDTSCLNGGDLRLTAASGVYGPSNPATLPQPFSGDTIVYHYWQPGDKNAWMWNPQKYYSDDHVNPGSIDYYLNLNQYPGGGFTLWTMIKPTNPEVYFQYIYEGVPGAGGDSGTSPTVTSSTTPIGSSGGTTIGGGATSGGSSGGSTAGGGAFVGGVPSGVGCSKPGITVTAVDNDPANQFSWCANRVPFGNEETDKGRCFSFHYTVPKTGVTSAILSVKIKPLGGLDDTDSMIAAVGSTQQGCDEKMPCVPLHGGFAGHGDRVDVDLLNAGCDKEIYVSDTAKQALATQLQTGVLHVQLQDDTAVYGAQLLLNCEPSCPGPTGGGTGTTGTGVGTVTAPPTTTRPPTVAITTLTGGTTTGRNSCPASGMLVYIDPWTPSPGQTIEVPVWCCNADSLANMDLSILYDRSVLTFVSARRGGLLGSDFLFESNEPVGGQIKISFAGTKGVHGSGAIAILTFRVAGATGASTSISPTVNTASNSNGGSLTVPTSSGTVTVTPPNPTNPEGRPCGPTALTALKALQMAVNKIPMDMAYDVNRDGTVNSADARELLRLAADQVCVL